MKEDRLRFIGRVGEDDRAGRCAESVLCSEKFVRPVGLALDVADHLVDDLGRERAVVHEIVGRRAQRPDVHDGCQALADIAGRTRRRGKDQLVEAILGIIRMSDRPGHAPHLRRNLAEGAPRKLVRSQGSRLGRADPVERRLVTGLRHRRRGKQR